MGETTPKSTYDWSVYKFCNSSQDLITKYCSESDYGDDGFTDRLTKLLPEDDAATVNWGNEWQTPSNEQYQELINRNYTTTTWTMQNGVYGRKITSKSNGNCIFLPAAGCYYDVGLYFVGIYGYYCSRSLEKSFCIYSNYRTSTQIMPTHTAIAATTVYPYVLCGQSDAMQELESYNANTDQR